MKIAQIVPLYEAVPPRLYGGTERVVAHLTQALIDLGHEVTLFASADSRTDARLVAMRKQALRLDPAPLKSDLASHLILLQEVRRHADEFDVLHFHIDLLHFPFFEDMAGRTLTTVHGRLDMKDLPEAYRRWNAFPLASISEDQRRPLPFAHWHGTVHHGTDGERFHYHDASDDDYLAFLGRISPEKRPDRAIAIAIRAGLPLRMAAKVDTADREYFEQRIRPLLDHPLIEFLGEINDADKVEFLGNASALLFPIDWPEPFGLAMIEAMACGTPVIAWRCGAVPEVVEQGVSGFIVDSDEQAVAAVHQAQALDRRRVRAAFERRFSSKIMASAYVDLYQRLPAFVGRDPAPAALPPGGPNP
ncbi:UDP-Glycosyltransferase/glycogen phosphorylase [Azotobacter vinelandii CA]|uniref:UDP-Glycosyltransferase/glycogen phosphorylase n=2 Tax=Azotobacter vinelandii TaxID=354 RepID=C1DSI7_AZOVD|nr:glycosyltransferase family 4 protein [Azotobacter vinelandii]ACO77942.1 UDP-Glycosyltransferase/glycogen phosphorylase [Azotobacter vinelandii DJ]AGK16925.1 UDP-Glycosyltransferase/glycogen phosphorylase [Azotobacter vinelandii CA]AGK20106.1 UDP-Glycosyltransferase/glycogen phosphorylase [Azotobacter vinelandii CA6]WKN23675.1 glycosyltransferase family 4 protein [Azotobacter vinelandii]SFX99730.1 Glycosyltransferase involved in cell wall bisynthesis [Azotobacter vinelandii]